MKRDLDSGHIVTAGVAAHAEGHARAFMIVAVTIGVVFAWGVAWYWPTAAGIVRIWLHSDTYAHGLIVLPVFVWLVWRARARIGGLLPQPVPWMALPVAAAGLLWLLGKMGGVAAAAHFALLAMIVAALVGALGWRLSRILLFPFAFLMLAVPIGDFLLPTLMNLTATFTVHALRWSGIPVYREGLYFVVPNGNWSVVEACSGIRYLIASVTVGALYAYLTFATLRRRLLFMVAALVVPIVANWMRAYMIVVLGYLTDNRLAAGVDHLIYGWGFFGVVIVLMFWTANRWREPAPAVPCREPVAAPAGRVSWRGVVPVLAAVAVFPFAERALDRPVGDYAVKLELPAPARGWSAEAEGRLAYRPHYAGARGTAFAAYRASDGEPVGVYVAWYADQREGREMVAWGNGLAPPGYGAVRVLGETEHVTAIGRVLGAELLTSQGRMRAWRWYRVDGRALTGDSDAKLQLAFARITGRSDDSAAIVLVTPLGDRPEEADGRLDGFLRAHAAALDATVAAPPRGAAR